MSLEPDAGAKWNELVDYEKISAGSKCLRAQARVHPAPAIHLSAMSNETTQNAGD